MKFLSICLQTLLGLIFALQVNSFMIQGVIDNKGLKHLDYSNTKVILNGGEFTGFVNNMGAFNIYVPKNGTYKLDVVNLNYHFESVIVEILNVDQNDEVAKKRQIRAYMYNIKSGKDYKLVYPLQLEPSNRIQYFEIEEPFNPLVYLKNPMVLMVGVSAVLMFMMKRMPKQELEDMQQMQKDQMPSCAQQ
eukprot:403341402